MIWRKDRVKIMNRLPVSIKDAIIDSKIKNTHNVNLIPNKTSFSRNWWIEWKVMSVLSKYADVENFDQRAKSAFDNFFKEFNFKKN